MERDILVAVVVRTAVVVVGPAWRIVVVTLQDQQSQLFTVSTYYRGDLLRLLKIDLVPFELGTHCAHRGNRT